MKYGILGLRDFNGAIYDNFEYISKVLTAFATHARMDYIISGGGKGVEKLVERWSDENNMTCQVILPNIKAHGKEDAFLIRNMDIIKECEELLIFWDGVHTGVLRSCGHAMKEGKVAHIIPVR